MRAIGQALAHLALGASPRSSVIHRRRHIAVDADELALLLLDEHIEGGRRLALEHRLLRAAPPRLLIPQRHRLDAPHQIATASG